MAKILVCGSAVLDFVFRVDTFPDRPDKYAAQAADIVGGGCAANAAVAIARLGGSPVLAARFGTDPVADLILAELEAEGVDISLVQRSDDGRSAFSSIYVDAAGERQIMSFRGERLPETFTPEGTYDAVLADTRWPAAARAVLDFARDADIPGVLDGEDPVTEEVAEAASHVVFSAQGLRAFTGEGTIEKGLQKAGGLLPGWFAVTDGERGVTIDDSGDRLQIAATKVEAVDTLAAGDVWHGAFTLALAEGAIPAHAVLFANAAAALKCTRPGGRRGAPNREDTLAFLKDNA